MCGAPLAGAWIEIPVLLICAESPDVAPLAGAWIEIIRNGIAKRAMLVAPLAGAWIEIRETIYSVDDFPCRSPRGSVD